MTEARAAATTFDGERIRITTPRLFDQVLAQLHEHIGIARLEQYPATMEKIGGINEKNFRTVVHTQLGPSDFMLFHEINHSQWLPIYGITRRVVRLIFGNPLVAITMMRDDLTAGLFAPVEVLLVEGENGEGCSAVYILPSSLIAAEDPSLLPAARELDEKLNVLMSGVTGVPMSLSST
jgi:uncharacterized protein (DUF302 family)